MDWNYVQPVKIRFGKGKRTELLTIIKELGVTKGLLVSGASFVKNGIAESMVKNSEGKIISVFSDISPNPDVTQVDACAAYIRKNDIDFIVALGGGSVLDLAKAASVLAGTNESICHYHGTGISLPEEHLPLIAIPTTAGTGSEVTNVSVLTNRKTGKKAPFASDSFYPVYAIIDSELTYTMPPKVTAETGIDALSHALEAYQSKGHQPICDALAIQAAYLVFHYLERAYENPKDEEAREKMCEASLIAGLSFNQPKTAASHACSFPLTNIYQISHGEACGLTQDYFLKINRKGPEGYRIEELAHRLGFADGGALADEIHDLKERLHLRNDIKDLALTKEQIKELVDKSIHPNLANNPVEITKEMLLEMYCKLAQGD